MVALQYMVKIFAIYQLFMMKCSHFQHQMRDGAERVAQGRPDRSSSEPALQREITFTFLLRGQFFHSSFSCISRRFCESVRFFLFLRFYQLNPEHFEDENDGESCKKNTRIFSLKIRVVIHEL